MNCLCLHHAVATLLLPREPPRGHPVDVLAPLPKPTRHPRPLRSKGPSTLRKLHQSKKKSPSFLDLNYSMMFSTSIRHLFRLSPFIWHTTASMPLRTSESS